MKKIIMTVTALLAVTLIAAILMTGSNSRSSAIDYNDATVKAYEQQLKDIEAKKQEILANLNQVQNDITKAQEYSEYIDNLLNSSVKKIDLAEEMLEALSGNIADTEAKIEAQKKLIDETFDGFLKRIRVAREEGETSYIGLLLGADSLTDFLTRLDRITTMLTYDKKLKSTYMTTKDELEAALASIEEAKAKQEATVEQLRLDREEYEQLAKDSEAYYEQLRLDEEAASQYYWATQAEEEETQKALDDYIAWLKAQQPESEYTGEGFIWPNRSDMYGVTSPFGWRIIFGGWDNHLGIDTWGYECYGKDILASSGGTVTVASEQGTYGNLVVIDHGSGIETRYAHCSEILVQPGQYVRQGEVIAKVGNSGRVTGAHLHFEYRVNGVPYDPLQYIQVPADVVYYY